MEQAKRLSKTTESKSSQAEPKKANQKTKTAFYVAQRNVKIKCKEKEYHFFAGSIYKNLPDCEEIKKLIKDKTFKKL